MLETTTKTETGKELTMWVEDRQMKASLEGLFKNHKFHRTNKQGHDVISCGKIKHNGKIVNALIKVNEDVVDFIEKAKAEIERQEEEERNSELTFKVIETRRSGAWVTQDLVLDPQKKLLTDEQKEQVEEVRSLLGETALFAGAGKYIKAKELSVEEGQEITLTELLEMVKETEKYQAKMEKERVEEEKYEEALQEARETGENVELKRYSAPCNDPKEECNIDIIIVYVTPSGRTKETRVHTY